ncbi:protein phosphatase 2C 51 [Ziziphus jujuba]|uniref:protein-serine/threonine phosphatase n=1 Tax=Ziziphus jujuba TaxID=326968 RepID=A0A6P4B372_ZIZJJ|nr:protein phosphatase 2C 51 [Ziziphus jujuba]
MTGSENFDSKVIAEKKSRDGRCKRLKKNESLENMTDSESFDSKVIAEKKLRHSRCKRLRLQKPLKKYSMESLNPREIGYRFEDCSHKRRMNGIAELTPCEVALTSSRDAKLNSDTSFSESSSSESSERSSDERGRPIDILVSDGKEEDRRSSACVSHGFISVIGRRRAMEDAVAVAKMDPYNFFAVYDGHGGFEVANACRDRLHELLEKEVEEWRCGGGGGGGEIVDWEKVMTESFSKMDEEVDGGEVEPEIGESVSMNTIGSTATVVVVGKKEIVVANCGDSRAVLWRGSAAVPLSRDHKPDRPDELERVEAAGGRVINWNGCRVLGVLATSRSIGDHYLKPYVICEPEVTISKRTDSDAFIVIATDGLWDVVTNEFACEVVRRCLDGQIKRRFSEGSSANAAAEAAALLAELALARGSKDNISVIVVRLNK